MKMTELLLLNVCWFTVNLYTVELQWLQHLWNHENMFEIGVVQANEC